jgi:hypothetical protein
METVQFKSKFNLTVIIRTLINTFGVETRKPEEDWSLQIITLHAFLSMYEGNEVSSP